MTKYTLDIEIDPASLRIIKAAQLKVTIAKPVSNKDPNITWLVFDPFQGNKVEWEESYSIYASSTPISQNGATITRMSETNFPSQDAAYYSFGGDATFNGPYFGTSAPPSGSYSIQNNMPNTEHPALIFGLQQEASINSRGISASPINAASVPFQFNATFTPLETVYVWLQAQFASGTVITQVNGKAAIVRFGDQDTHKSILFNPATGTFVPSSGRNMRLYSSSRAPRMRASRSRSPRMLVSSDDLQSELVSSDDLQSELVSSDDLQSELVDYPEDSNVTLLKQSGVY